ncbi:patatin-like phospholipase family protein [Neolewinella aurantiaca]|nr:patatin-like phospholipase family protein [Neolewinella aurantiaca]
MTTHNYTSRVLDIVLQLKADRTKRPEDFRFSDIFDDEGNQYVNLVQEGGGVHGIALVGFTYVLEEMGIRFLSLGGTSAGSINTLLMADTGHPSSRKSLKIIEKIADKNFMDFVDGGSDARAFVKSLAEGISPMLFLNASRNASEMINNLGVNPGVEFHRWLSGLLFHKSWGELENNIRCLEKELIMMDNHGNERRRLSAEELGIKIAIVAADITTQTKVDFPDMADLYYENPMGQNPADFVRASMSIPFFFEPVRADLSWVNKSDEATRKNWVDRANYHGELPGEVLFVDGGVMSNFPIDLFHKEDQIPNRPTIGIKLGADRRASKPTTGITSFVGNIFDGVRNLRDHEFLVQNPEYKELIEHINVDDFNWLDFAISDADKLRLFERGAEAAASFLRRFQWLDYKNQIRNSLLQSVKPLMWELSGSKGLTEKLASFGIHEDSRLMKRIRHLRERADAYKVLWIDDAFTYGLPVAILDSLNIFTYTVQNSDDARALLLHKNRKNGPETERINLILSDVTRNVEGKKDRIAGIRFAEELAHNQRLKDVPVLLYAHSGEDLLARYRGYEKDDTLELPHNIKNHPKGDTTKHFVFIREVVDCIYENLPGKRAGCV